MGVKGLTWGTPEFVKIAKQAEAEFEVSEILSDMDDAVASLIDNRGFTQDLRQRSALISIRNDLSEILGFYDESWEASE
jgi:hypothetical protein